MLRPLEQWICDTCGGVIDGPDDGYLEWLSGYGERVNDDEPKLAHGWRIVHAGRPNRDCYKYTNARGRADMDLKHFIGPGGLSYLLSKLDVGHLFDPERRGYEGIRDPREFVHTVRRLHVPFYEEASPLLDRAWRDGELDGHDPWTAYLPETLERIVRHYCDRDEE